MEPMPIKHVPIGDDLLAIDVVVLDDEPFFLTVDKNGEFSVVNVYSCKADVDWLMGRKE